MIRVSFCALLLAVLAFGQGPRFPVIPSSGGASVTHASQVQAEAGTDTSTVVDPAGVSAAIKANVMSGDGVSCIPTGAGVECSVNGTVVRVSSGTTVPGSCTAVSQAFIDTDASTGQKVYWCNGSTYEAFAGGASIPSTTAILKGNGSGGASAATANTDYAAATHATRHQNGGADEIATATPAANAIPKAGSGGKLAASWISPADPIWNYTTGVTSTLSTNEVWQPSAYAANTFAVGSRLKCMFYAVKAAGANTTHENTITLRFGLGGSYLETTVQANGASENLFAETDVYFVAANTQVALTRAYRPSTGGAIGLSGLVQTLTLDTTTALAVDLRGWLTSAYVDDSFSVYSRCETHGN